MPKVDERDHTSALGVTLVQLITERDLRWIFRRSEHRDKGIDAVLETTIGDFATGHYLAMQIKTGASFFREPTTDGWRFRGDFDHLHYWLDNRLPVLLVLVDVQDDAAYWARISEEAVQRTEKGWTIEVPRHQAFGKPSAATLLKLARARDPLDALMRTCHDHRDLLLHLVNDGEVSVEFGEWVNKSSGRCDVGVFFDDEMQPRTEFSIFAATVDEELLKELFPWADAEISEDFYEDNEDVPPEAVFQDSESPGGYYVVDGKRPTGWRPYKSNGEVDSYRISLTLNDVGKAFLTLSRATDRHTA